jgi:hypothetical protein
MRRVTRGSIIAVRTVPGRANPNYDRFFLDFLRDLRPAV